MALELTYSTCCVRDEIIQVALDLEVGGDDPLLLRAIRRTYPELSRGELGDAFSAAGDALRGWPGLVNDRPLDETFDDAAWALLSRDDLAEGWPQHPRSRT